MDIQLNSIPKINNVSKVSTVSRDFLDTEFEISKLKFKVKEEGKKNKSSLKYKEESLTLYYKPECPYCQKVLNFLETEDISMTLKDMSKDPSLKEELIAIGEKKQVPCLIHDGKPLYESDDIIKWLKSS